MRDVGSPTILLTILGKLAMIAAVVVEVSEDAILNCFFSGSGVSQLTPMSESLFFYFKAPLRPVRLS